MDECARLMAEMLSRARKAPDAPAVCDRGGSRTLTAAEFWSCIGRISNLLRLKGVSTGDVVVIDLGRNAEHLASRYAALAVGAVPVSLSPAYPEARKKAVAERTGAKAVIDEGFVQESAGCPDEPAFADVPDEAPGYIAFTSGSTGEPKGVVHERSVFPYLMDCYRSADVDITGMRLGALSDFSFIASMVETHIFLAAGAEVHVIDREAAKDPASLLRYFKSNSIDSALFNPSMYKALWRQLGLKICLLAGEAARKIPVPESRMVLNIYGSTEALMSFTLVEDMKEPCVDRTAPGCRLYLDDSGEVLFTGRGVMIGYLGGLENPFSVDADGRKVFRTGDLGREVEGGIAVVGRMDGMVKVRGYRVEPAEVERGMESVPGVEEAVVKAFPDGDSNYLCGYYTSATVYEDAVASALSSILPDYMIPRAIVRMSDFKRNANGKIDRTSLQEPSLGRAEYVPPSNDKEKALCDGFGIVLGIGEVGLDDDFVLLGGDSIKAMGLANSLREGFPDLFAGLRTADVLELRTPGRIAGRDYSAEIPVQEYDYDSGFPAPDAVRDGYMMATELDEPHYALLFSIKSPEWTDPVRLRKAVESVTQAFPAFRMRLERDGDEIWARFSDKACIETKQGDPKTVFEGCRRGFDPDGAVLSRFIICEEEGRASVLMYVSHMVFDGRSARPLAEAFTKAYRGMPLETDRGLALQSAHDVSIRGSASYYRSKKALEEAARPVRGSVGLPRTQASGGGAMTYVLSVGDAKLREFARRNGVTATVVAAAAFGLAKARIEGGTESFCSLTTDGRSVPGTEDSVGMFVRFVPLHVVYDDMPLDAFLRRVGDSITSLLSNSGYPLWAKESLFYPDESFSFQYANYADEIAGSGMTYEGMDHGYWFECSALEVHPVDGRNVAVLEYAMCHTEKDMVRLIDEFDRVLSRMMDARTTKELFHRWRRSADRIVIRCR
ncbi:MAG: AMP-binding protein [Candidatus Methanomethylophilaceae archaeon]|nr:AMP-binding protein [Candidatus Methanomethylophilaceae archaeon]